MCNYLKYLFQCHFTFAADWDQIVGVHPSWPHVDRPTRPGVINRLDCPHPDAASGNCPNVTFCDLDPLVYPMICYQCRKALMCKSMDKIGTVTRGMTSEVIVLGEKPKASDEFIAAIETALREVRNSLLYAFNEEERILKQEWYNAIATLQTNGRPLPDPIPTVKPLDYESYNDRYEKLVSEGGRLLDIETWRAKEPESSSAGLKDWEKKRLEEKRLDKFHREMAKAIGNGDINVVEILTVATGIEPRQPVG
ncbi:hypothetical protein V8F33_009091 [Rhypophila sp. PSN 637]